jgi:predicted  nucleic acid-binding Zn-ribbon protein
LFREWNDYIGEERKGAGVADSVRGKGSPAGLKSAGTRNPGTSGSVPGVPSTDGAGLRAPAGDASVAPSSANRLRDAAISPIPYPSIKLGDVKKDFDDYLNFAYAMFNYHNQVVSGGGRNWFDLDKLGYAPGAEARKMLDAFAKESMTPELAYDLVMADFKRQEMLAAQWPAHASALHWKHDDKLLELEQKILGRIKGLPPGDLKRDHRFKVLAGLAFMRHYLVIEIHDLKARKQTAQLPALQSRLKDLEGRIAALELDIVQNPEPLPRAGKANTADVSAWLADAAGADDRIKKDVKKRKDTESALAAAKAEKATLPGRIAELEAQRNRLGVEQTPHLQERDHLTAALAPDTAVAEAAQQLINTLQAETERLRGDTKKTTDPRELSRILGRLKEIQKEVARARQQLSAAKQRLASTQASLASVQERIASLQTRIDRTEADLKTAKARLSALEKDIPALESKIAKLGVAIENAYADRNSGLDKAIGKQKAEISSDKAQVDDFAGRISELESALVANRQRLQGLKDEREALVRKIPELEATLKDLNSRRIDLQNQEARLRAEIKKGRKDLQGAADDLHKQVVDLSVLCSKTSAEWGTAIRDKQAAEAKIPGVEHEIARQLGRLDVLKDRLADWKRKLDIDEGSLKELAAARDRDPRK